MERHVVPTYLELVLNLFSAVLVQDRAGIEEVHDAITEYGWERGPALVADIATTHVITLIHEGGLRSEFSAEWMAEWQHLVESRHRTWGKVPPSLLRSLVLIARGDKETVMTTPQSTRCVWQALFVTTVAMEKYGEDTNAILDFIGAMLSIGPPTIRRMVENGSLPFEP